MCVDLGSKSSRVDPGPLEGREKPCPFWYESRLDDCFSISRGEKVVWESILSMESNSLHCVH